ncbi:MAG: YggS family pyridoxal phosphate-dependent enzyme [Nakamurella sp.]
MTTQGDDPTADQEALNDPLVARLTRLRAEIDDAATQSGRAPEEVSLLLATKTQPADRIRVAIAAGYSLIGENRVQEVVKKAEALTHVPHELHFIGHLQANKVNQLLPHISCLQTLDSVELAGKLNSRLDILDRQLDVLLQVNVSGEESKSGVQPAEAVDLLGALAEFPRLRVRGYMTIGLNSPDRSAVRAGFRNLAELRESAVTARVPGAAGAVELSMGMSGDFVDAIAEGATIVRLGSAVFGERPSKQATG